MYDRGARMLNSMTGYASHGGTLPSHDGQTRWEWELRAANGRGLDLRLRLPEGYGFIEKTLRDKLAAQVTRGHVTCSLRVVHERADADGQVSDAALESLLRMLVHVQAKAAVAGVLLAAPSALDLLGWRGVHHQGHDPAIIAPSELGSALCADFGILLDRFVLSRAVEGAALHDILLARLGEIAALVAQARALVPERGQALRAQFQTILSQFADTSVADPVRMEQELALLAVKGDVTEELDRLAAHCTSAHTLLQSGGAVGRQLDFLTQEFNREANTLCAKAQHLELTRIGLALKSVIDQMREQVQNLE